MATVQTISLFCPKCHKYTRSNINPESVSIPLICIHCQHQWGDLVEVSKVFDRCPVCQCRQFYKDKDFNQIIGFAIMGVGVVLVPLTYGLSLPFFAFIDWLFYLSVPWLIACYRCGGEFRGFNQEIDRFKPFMHHIGLKYDKYRK